MAPFFQLACIEGEDLLHKMQRENILSGEKKWKNGPAHVDVCWEKKTCVVVVVVWLICAG